MNNKPKYYYRIVHTWLNKNYGKANHCEHCSKPSKRFEYALKHGFKHERNIDNYIQLCTKCHRLYDMTPEKRVKATQHLAGKYNDNLILGPISRIGKPVSEETREKIRLSKLGRRFDSSSRKYLPCR